jgi:hypothetical protein
MPTISDVTASVGLRGGICAELDHPSGGLVDPLCLRVGACCYHHTAEDAGV